MSFRRVLQWPSCMHDRYNVHPGAVAACSTAHTGVSSYRLLTTVKKPTNAENSSSPQIIPLPKPWSISKPSRGSAYVSSGYAYDNTSPYKHRPVYPGEEETLKSKNTREQMRQHVRIRYQTAMPDSLKYHSNGSKTQRGSITDVLSPPPLPPSQSGRIFKNWKPIWNELYSKLIERRENPENQDQEIFTAQREYADKFLANLTMEQLRSKLLFLGPKGRSNTLPSLLIGSLLLSPEQTLFVLSCPIGIWNDFRTRMQCLRHLHVAYETQIRQSLELTKQFEEQIRRCRSPKAWTDPSFSPLFLDTLLKWSNPKDCETLVCDYMRCYPYSQPQAFLPIIMHYVRLGNAEKALEIFRKLPRDFVQSGAPELKTARDSLLMMDTITTTEAGANFRVLPELLTLGVQPDADLHNIMIERAIVGEMPNVAWDLYHWLKSEGLEVNAKTHLNLLQDSFRRYYTKGVSEIMTAIHDSDGLGKNPYLITYSMNIVRCVSFSSYKSSPADAFGKVMALFDRLWSREALHQFGILHGISANAADLTKPEPPPASLAFTLWSYILVQRSEKFGDNLWQRMLRLIEANNETALAVLRYDIVYNALILLYARKLDTLNKALRVVQYMLEKELCPPGARTWSMLICAFLRHRQLDQAKIVMQMMITRGLKVESISEPHMPAEYSLADFQSRVEAELDERQMPGGLQEILNFPTSS